MSESKEKMDWFVKARYGMFIHYGLYSELGRGEWVMNKERTSLAEMRAQAARFNPVNFDADAVCDLAVAGGMRYVNLTTMHHLVYFLIGLWVSGPRQPVFCENK